MTTPTALVIIAFGDRRVVQTAEELCYRVEKITASPPNGQASDHGTRKRLRPAAREEQKGSLNLE